MHAAPERTWWQRNLKWVIAAAVLASLLLFALFIGAIFYAVVAATRSSEVYQTATARAKAHPAVIEHLGQPIEPGWLVQGRIEVSGREGEADLGIPIRGPRAEGEISVVAQKRAGNWTYEVLEVRIEDRPPIDLREPEEGDPPAPRR
jgi:hypothetical protein